jgi:hypothetical protein
VLCDQFVHKVALDWAVPGQTRLPTIVTNGFLLGMGGGIVLPVVELPLKVLDQVVTVA